jgi:hypothetical protein
MKQEYEGSAALWEAGLRVFPVYGVCKWKEQDERSTEHYCGYFEVVGRSMRWNISASNA